VNFSSRARICLMSAGIAVAALLPGGIARAQEPDFGAAPSGEVPILFNDRHVYSKPDKLRAARVLAALVRGGEILVPLRSLFEQTGATVSYDAKTRTVHLSKTGADVVVTVGKPVVTINGDDRPLDVPPEIHDGVVLVPLRVLSEGMGAYVQWVPERHVVVVRYITIEATPPPSPPPAPVPIPIVPPVPPEPPVIPAPATPTPVTQAYEKWIEGDYDIQPIVDNEVSPGKAGFDSFSVDGGFEFPVNAQRWMLEANWRHTEFSHLANLPLTGCAAGTTGCNTVDGSDPFFQPGLCPSHDPGCVTVIGFRHIVAFNGLGQAYVPAFTGTEDDVDARLALKVADPRIYLGVGGYFKHNNYLGYPNLVGIGAGLEKLPDLDRAFSLYASIWYYPYISGMYTFPSSAFLGGLSGSRVSVSYAALKYDVGATYALGATPLFINFGYGGENLHSIQNAPSDTTVNAPYAGLGLHL